MNKRKTDLVARVKKAKEFLDYHEVENAKNIFFDTAFGPMYKSETTRVDNLWTGRLVDEDFTVKLEKFAENPKRKIGTGAEFNRFMAFVDWYMRMGGKPLTLKQIERAYPKFKY